MPKLTAYPNASRGTRRTLTLQQHHHPQQLQADSGEWKETASFSPTDLAVVSQLAGQAFQEIDCSSSSRAGAGAKTVGMAIPTTLRVSLMKLGMWTFAAGPLKE